jgi:hypothetical protein
MMPSYPFGALKGKKKYIGIKAAFPGGLPKRGFSSSSQWKLAILGAPRSITVAAASQSLPFSSCLSLFPL